MSEPQSDTVLQRLECLEQEVRRCKRESRWWRVVGSGAVVALVAVLLVGATGSKVAEEVRARQFTVVDGDNKTRAQLSVFPDGGAALVVFGRDQKPRVSLGTGTVTGEAEVPPELRLKEKDFPVLVLLDKAGQKRIGLSLMPDGNPLFDGAWITLADTSKAIAFSMRLTSSGEPSLTLTRNYALVRTWLTTDSLSASGPVGQTHTWVLWEQPPVNELQLGGGMGLKTPPIALGAWPTQSQCEAEALKLRQQQGSGQTVRLVYTCLPDTVNLRTQP